MNGSGYGGKSGGGEQAFIASIASRPDIRLFLVCGPDQSAVADIAQKLFATYGKEAELVELESDQIHRDPALLVDEASAIGLFGDKRYIRLNITREHGLEALENLLNTSVAGNPVIATAGDLKKTSKIRKLVEGDKLALAHICYLPDAGQLAPMIQNMARDAGLRLDRSMAQMIADATGNDRKLAAAEIEKLALYYDAAPDNPVDVEPQILADLSAATEQEDMGPLINSVFGGNIRNLSADIREAREAGINPVAFLRALQRRIAQMDEISVKLKGASPNIDAVKRAGVFWKEADAFARQMQYWPPDRLAGLNGHVLSIEKRMMEVKADLGQVIFEEELIRIAKAAQRRR